MNSKNDGQLFHLPFMTWYKRFFTDRVVILTGVGRSGTSVMGRLMASFRPMYYFFEPSTPKALIPNPALLRLIFFEEHVLPLAQGRNLNGDPSTESWYNFYLTEEEIKYRWENKRRIDLLPIIMNQNAPVVIKLTEMSLMVESMRNAFPNCRFVHIIRNGNDVIQSAMRPGWYNDLYMAINSVDWVETRERSNPVKDETRFYNIPYFVSAWDSEAADGWSDYNHATRCAAAWRCATEPMAASEDDNGIIIIRYEELCNNPGSVANDLHEFYKSRNEDIIRTDMTNAYIENISKFKTTKYPDITDQIEEPERSKYLALMERLGYK